MLDDVDAHVRFGVWRFGHAENLEELADADAIGIRETVRVDDRLNGNAVEARDRRDPLARPDDVDGGSRRGGSRGRRRWRWLGGRRLGFGERRLFVGETGDPDDLADLDGVGILKAVDIEDRVEWEAVLLRECHIDPGGGGTTVDRQ